MRVRTRKNHQLYTQHLQRGGSFPVFAGRRRYGHSGGAHMGTVLGRFLTKSIAKPLISKILGVGKGVAKRTLRSAAKKIVPIASEVAVGVMSGKNPKKHVVEGMKRMARGAATSARDELLSELQQRGRGLRTRRKLQLKGL